MGAGAGAEPTASAVVADLIDIARGFDAPLASQVSAFGLYRAERYSCIAHQRN